MRVAVYFTPPAGHPLARAAAQWLGRDAFTGERLPPPPIRGLGGREVDAMTAAPRRYGFHATLKAPFRLAEGVRLSDVEAAAREFSASRAAFPAPRLGVQPLDGFLALTPEGECPSLGRLADEAVRAFEPFRAPLASTEIEHRAVGLDEAHRRHLEEWGDPYVFDQFRFHMTLTGTLEATECPHVLALLRERFRAPLDEPLSIDAVALFVEPEPGADFRVHAYVPFSAGGPA